MNNIDLYIEELEASKVEIKEAIIAKGVTPEGGLSSYAAAIESITISDPTLEELSVQLTENGTYNYTPTDDGYSSVEVIVDVPEPDLRQLNLSVTENGSYEYDTPDNIDGYNKVNLTVEVAGSGDGGKPKIYNGTIINTGITISSDRGYPDSVDFSQYDWSRVYDGCYFFNNAFAPSYNTPVDWSNFEENFNGKFLSAKYMFHHNSSGSSSANITYPAMNGKMDDCLVMSYMFANNKNTYNFSGIANWNTTKVLATDRMFYQCESLQKVPLFDTSNVVNMDYMFYYCRYLGNLPEFDIGNVLTAKYMFSNCMYSLESIPSTLNTGNIRYADNMFYSCQKLSDIPELDWGNLRSCTYMFGNCSKLSKLPNMNTKNVIHFGTGTSNSWLYEVRGIGELGVIDCDSCINIGYMFPNVVTVHTLGGFRNLGKQPSLTGTNNTYFLAQQSKLTYESIMNVINMLYDRASAGFSVLTLKLHANVLALLSEDDIAIATNKGWTIA